MGGKGNKQNAIKNFIRSTLVSSFSKSKSDFITQCPYSPFGKIHYTILKCFRMCWKDNPPTIETIDVQKEKYTVIVNVPHNMSFQEFRSKERLLAFHIGGDVFIEQKGKVAVMTVCTEPLKSEYPYSTFEDYWQAHKEEPKYKMLLPVCIGYSAKGIIIEDLSEILAILVGGHQKSGKSVFVRSLVTSALSLSPDLITLTGIDLKRGVEFAYLEKCGTIISDKAQVATKLRALSQRIDKKYDILKANGCLRIQDYLESGGKMKFDLLVIDELAELQDKDALYLLNHLLRTGRAAGLITIAATQKPSADMFGQARWSESRAQFLATACFHVRNSSDSEAVLGKGNTRGSEIPLIPGRCVWAYDHEYEVQVPHLKINHAKKLLPKGVDDDGEQQRKVLLPRRETSDIPRRMGSTDTGANTAPVSLPLSPGNSTAASQTIPVG